MPEKKYSCGDRVFFSVPERYKCSIEEYRKAVAGKLNQSYIDKITKLANSMVTITESHNTGGKQYYKIKEFDSILITYDWFSDGDIFEPADDDTFNDFLGDMA